MVDRFGYGEIGLDINPCRGCDDYDVPDGCQSNGGYGKQITNADRIRAMSDEELAEFIGGIFTVERDVWGDYDPRLVVTQEPRVEVRDKEDMMDWLQSPACGGDKDG